MGRRKKGSCAGLSLICHQCSIHWESPKVQASRDKCYWTLVTLHRGYKIECNEIEPELMFLLVFPLADWLVHQSKNPSVMIVVTLISVLRCYVVRCVTIWLLNKCRNVLALLLLRWILPTLAVCPVLKLLRTKNKMHHYHYSFDKSNPQ